MRSSSGTFLGSWSFKTLILGGGGFVTGISIANDGTKIIRTDVFNCWIKEPGNAKWRAAFTLTSLPTGDYHDSVGWVPPDSSIRDSTPMGGFACTVAPSDSTRMYATCNCRLYSSTDTGRTWTRTAVPQIDMRPNAGNPVHGICWQRLTVDPNNPSVFLFGTSKDGVYASTDGGATVTQITSVGANTVTSGSYTSPHISACDPTSTQTGGIRQRWFIATQGVGVYQSTTGPTGTYTLMTGSPAQCFDMRFAADGTCWVVAGPVSSNNLWKWTPGGGWVAITTTNNSNFSSIAINPANTLQIHACDPNSYYEYSMDGGATWHRVFATSGGGIGRSAYSVRWQDSGPNTTFAGGQLAFDPSQSNVLYATSGIGVWHCTPPTGSGGYYWTEEIAGQEELVANRMITPPGCDPQALCWDRAVWDITNPDQSPPGYVTPGDGRAAGVVHGWDGDWAADNPKWIAVLCNWNGSHHGFSSDGGKTWGPYPTAPINSANGGCIAVGQTGQVLHVYSDNGRPVYTTDGGNTWNYMSFPGLPTSGEKGFGFSHSDNRKIATYDKVAGAFYIRNYGPTQNAAIRGIWKSTDLVNWTQVFTGYVGGSLGIDTSTAKLAAVPNNAGHLFFTPGKADSGSTPLGFFRSTDGGVTWTTVANCTNVPAFGFGKTAPGQTYPAVYFSGLYNGTYGLWATFDNFATVINISTNPNGSIDFVSCVTGDLNKFGRVYVGFNGSGFCYGDYKYQMALAA